MEKTQSASISIIDRFAGVDDPRMERAGKRKLGDIIAVGVGDVIAGADNRVDIATFGNAKIKWFESFLELPNGISSHDAFGRVFSLRVCLIIDAGSAGVSPATPEARINHRQTTLLVSTEPAEARICRGSQASQTTLFGFIKHTLIDARNFQDVFIEWTKRV